MEKKLTILLILMIFSLFTVEAQSLLSKEKKNSEVFTVVEDMPIPWFYKTECIDEAPDDKQNCYYTKLKAFLGNKLEYPYTAMKNKTEGVVIVQFVISKDGSITEATIVKDIGDGCGEAALKAIKKMPNWIPGRQRGEPVNVKYTLPVKFELKGK